MVRLHAWLTDGMHRIYSDSRRERLAGPAVVARGERLSAQVGLRLVAPGRTSAKGVRVSCQNPSGVEVRVRRVGYVPVPHHNLPVIPGHAEGHFPCYVPDPLFDENETSLCPDETVSFWLTVRIAPDCRPGRKTIHVLLEPTSAAPTFALARLTLVIDVRPVTIQPRRDFPVTNWFYADALLDYYRLDGFTERFWSILRPYFDDLVEHGQDTVYVPVFTPPLDGVKRPTQLVNVTRSSASRYHFDWSDARRWVRLAAKAGLKRFEFTHLFTQWGAANAIGVYHGQGADERLLWPANTSATGRVYRGFLSQFLPQLQRFCASEGILARSLFHTSDEPHATHLAPYAAARLLLRDLAPWMRTFDALSDIAFARHGLVDMPVPSIATVDQFLKEARPCWTYFCCGPRGRYLQRLMDTPLAKTRAGGWLFYRTGVLGFLHWGYNYWYRRGSRELIDPFTVSDAGAAPAWAYGDTFMVYPGPAGPIDSVRWEVVADSLQDYALLQTLGVSRGDRRLARFGDYGHFPFSPALFASLRRSLLR